MSTDQIVGLIVLYMVVSVCCIGPNIYKETMNELRDAPKLVRFLLAILFTALCSACFIPIFMCSLIYDYVTVKKELRKPHDFSRRLAIRLQKGLYNKEDIFIVYKDQKLKLPDNISKELGFSLNEYISAGDQHFD